MAHAVFYETAAQASVVLLLALVFERAGLHSSLRRLGRLFVAVDVAAFGSPPAFGLAILAGWPTWLRDTLALRIWIAAMVALELLIVILFAALRRDGSSGPGQGSPR